MIGFDYRAPDTLDEVLAALADHGEDARLLAGGTALLLLIKQRLLQPAVLVSLKRLASLGRIERQDGVVRIGATATHRQVERHHLVREHLPALAETQRRVATPRIRNQATLGGNLTHADPSQDPPVTLIALDARVRLLSPTGMRELPVDELFADYYETVLRPGELLTDVLVPLPGPATGSAFVKFTPRTSDDYATVSAAARVRLVDGVCREARLSLGAVGPTPLRARAAEQVLEGERPTEQALRAAAETVTGLVDPLSDLRGSADYKREMAAVFAYRALARAVAQAGAPPA